MLIKNFLYRLFPPDCNPSSQKLNAIAELGEDIGEIFPYLNGVLKGCVYNPEAKTLSFKKDGHLIVLQPRQIAINKLNDEKEAEKIFHWLKEFINLTYEERGDLKPNYQSQEPLKVMDLFRLLPGSNCRQCGEPTCMAFAVKLQQDETSMAKCLPLFSEPYREKRQVLVKLLRAAGYAVPGAFS